MNFKQLILSTAAVSGFLMGVSALAPAPFSLSSVAHAETSVSVNFNIGSFYDRLEPYGNWVSFEDQYVFVPQHVARAWRPYTLGHWSYTHRYGWLWVSNERFGWATYHYGRWGHSRDLGWYWVPGRRWAPAWVAWSHGHNNVAWAPLPPRHGHNIDIDVSISIGDVPDYYWQAVPTSAFLSVNLSDRIIHDRGEVRTIVQQGTPQTVRIENNIVINNVIQVNEIEQATNTKVKVLEEKAVTSPDAAGKIQNNSVAIFNPEVNVDTAAKPKKEVKVEEIVTARKAQGIQPSDVPADEPVAKATAVDKNGKAIAPSPDQSATTPALDKNGKPIPNADQSAGKVEVDSNTDAAAIAKQKKIGTDTSQPAAVATPDAKAPDVKAQGQVDVNKTKDAKPTPAEPLATDAPAADTPVVKSKKDKAVVVPPADTGKATTQVPVEKLEKKKAVAEPVVPQDAQQGVKPKQTDQQPSDQKQKKQNDQGASDQQPVDQNSGDANAAKKPQVDENTPQKPKKKGDQPKDKCDPNTETCPPAQ